MFFITKLFFCSKYVRINGTHYVIFKLNNQRELQNIAINHSADIDYKDFVKIYRDCIKKPYNFLTIDATQPINDRFRKKIFFSFIKMTIIEQAKILDDKIRSSKAQYDLDR